MVFQLLGSNFFVGGSYASYSQDTIISSIDADLNFISLGIGVRKAVTANADLFGMISYENLEAALSSGFTSASIDDINGYSLKAGVRAMVLPKLELSATVSYTEYDDDSDDGLSATGFGVATAYYFTPRFALGAGYSTAEDEDTLSVTGTVSF